MLSLTIFVSLIIVANSSSPLSKVYFYAYHFVQWDKNPKPLIWAWDFYHCWSKMEMNDNNYEHTKFICYRACLQVVVSSQHYHSLQFCSMPYIFLLFIWVLLIFLTCFFRCVIFCSTLRLFWCV